MRIFHTNKPLIIITMGDPAGIGPEVLIKALERINSWDNLCAVIIGDIEKLKEIHSGTANLPLLNHSPDEDVHLKQNVLNVIDPGPCIDPVIPGFPVKSSDMKSLRFLDLAIEIIKDIPDNVPKAMITAPVNKEKIANLSEGFIGHTEYLQNAFSREHVTMSMVGKKFTTIPVTRHIPVKDIAKQLSADLLFKTLEDIANDLNMLTDKPDPVVCVCALNPHCGEGGKIGLEEIQIIQPVIEKAKIMFKKLIGPISSDVAFYKALKGEADVIVGMYHDQCLAPFKMVEFDTGVNTTLGLGFVRTSPDHGTAYDIAGKNIANPESMFQAINLAIKAISI